LIYEQAKLETEEERERVNGLEKNVAETYEKIPKMEHRVELTEAKKIDKIAQ
jgi:hypothetical protein